MKRSYNPNVENPGRYKLPEEFCDQMLVIDAHRYEALIRAEVISGLIEEMYLSLECYKYDSFLAAIFGPKPEKECENHEA